MGELVPKRVSSILVPGKKTSVPSVFQTKAVTLVREKSISINGTNVVVDPQELMRTVKYLTQTIGEHKNQNNASSYYIIPALRKARNQVVSDLETHFRITWEVDVLGNSKFTRM